MSSNIILGQKDLVLTKQDFMTLRFQICIVSRESRLKQSTVINTPQPTEKPSNGG